MALEVAVVLFRSLLFPFLCGWLVSVVVAVAVGFVKFSFLEIRVVLFVFRLVDKTHSCLFFASEQYFYPFCLVERNVPVPPTLIVVCLAFRLPGYWA